MILIIDVISRMSSLGRHLDVRFHGQDLCWFKSGDSFGPDRTRFDLPPIKTSRVLTVNAGNVIEATNAIPCHTLLTPLGMDGRDERDQESNSATSGPLRPLRLLITNQTNVV